MSVADENSRFDTYIPISSHTCVLFKSRNLGTGLVWIDVHTYGSLRVSAMLSCAGGQKRLQTPFVLPCKGQTLQAPRVTDLYYCCWVWMAMAMYSSHFVVSHCRSGGFDLLPMHDSAEKE